MNAVHIIPGGEAYAIGDQVYIGADIAADYLLLHGDGTRKPRGMTVTTCQAEPQPKPSRQQRRANERLQRKGWK